MKFNKKKLILVLVAVIAVVTLTGCGVQVNPENALTPETASGFWQSFLVLPIIQMITWLYGIIGNLGVAIIIATILTKAAVMPLMLKSMNNTAKMQTIQPEMDKIKQKYAGKSDRETQMKMYAEMQSLYKESGVNPLAGCLPIFIQMPILFAFYHAIMRTAEIKQHSFLWFDLGHADPYYILPIVAAITTFIQQKLAMAGTAGQNPQMAMMVWLMPIMILIFAINFPAALSLYWVVGNIFGIAQMYFIKGPEIKASKAGGSSK